MSEKGKRGWLMGVAVLLGCTVTAQAAENEGFSRDELAKRVGQVVDAIKSIDVYREPVAPQLNKEVMAMSCRDLEYELAALQPMTYSYKPDFYNDPVQGTAAWVSATQFWPPAYAVLGYTAYYDYQENERIYKAQDRIEVLRRAKAEKRCFES